MRRRLLVGGCGGCLTVPLGAVALLLLALLSPGDVTSAQAPPIAAAGPPGQAREISWQPLFPWTPPQGEPSAAGWPWGQCTWFVVSQGRSAGDHQVSWSGDAWQWIANAQAAGVQTEPVTQIPQVGWIAVYQRGHGASSSAGHVALVVAVSATSYTIAEANYLGLGIVDERTLPLPGAPNNGPLLEGWIP